MTKYVQIQEVDDEKKVEKFRLEDGRHAERHVTEGDDTRVIELHAEPMREKKLEKRITENKRKVVTGRVIEIIDPVTGKVTQRLEESIDPPESRMQLVKHLVQEEDKVQAQEVVDPAVTQQMLTQAIMDAARALKDCPEPAEAVHSKKPLRVSAQNVPDFSGYVPQAVKNSDTMSFISYGLVCFIAANLAWLGYNFYFQ